MKKQKNAIKWLEALLSRNYTQGRGKLGDTKEGFCCWGLGCYIIGIPFHPFEVWNDDLYKEIGFLNYDGNLTVPMLYVNIDGTFANEYHSLASANDSGYFSFAKIANHLIETAYGHFEPAVAKAIKAHFNVNA